MPQCQYGQSVYFSLISYRSFEIYQGSPFASVYYVTVHYISLETLARYTLNAC